MPSRPSMLASTDGTELELQSDLSILATGPNPAEDTYIVRIPTARRGLTGLRIEIMSDPSFRKGYARQQRHIALHELEIEVSSSVRDGLQDADQRS